MSPQTDAPSGPHEEVALRVSGMTCTSCALRIERSLDKLPTVDADVNFATGKAEVRFDPAVVDLAEILRAVRRSGYDATVALSSDASPRFHWWAIALAALVAAGAMVAPPTQLARDVELVATLVVLATAGRPFFVAAWNAARHRSVTMDTLVALGAGVAMTASAIVTVAGLQHEPTYFDAAAMIVAFIGIGKLLEERWTRRARAGLDALEELSRRTLARIDDDGSLHEVPLGELEAHDRVLVRPGDIVPADARVLDGDAAVDGALRTGRRDLRRVGPGDEVLGGDAVVGSSLTIELDAPARLGLVVELARLVEVAQHRRARLATLADRVSARFVPAVIAVAVVVAFVRLAIGAPVAIALSSAIAVVVVACPCAMGLATPIAFLVASTRAAARGIVLEHPDALEHATSIDTVVLDRTGTITEADLVAHWPERVALSERRLVAALAARSRHPVSRALSRVEGDPANASGDGNDPEPVVEHVVETPGVGVTGRVDGHEIAIGSPASVGATGVDPAASERAVFVRIDDQSPIVIELAERTREGTAATVAALHRLGARVILATGDSRPTLADEAREFGIDDVAIGLDPTAKVALVTKLRADGHHVAMVGDGTNDAAALATSDLGIALGGGTHLAQANADAVLLGDDIAMVPTVLDLARRTVRTIRQNLGWALGYNVIAIPAAAAGLLSPMVAAALMAMSSLVVVGNALRLDVRESAGASGTTEVR
ncbi:heavy metal translocating P-type ATPase [Acidimicrobium ferrooxidans DSM 10331]|uniref:Heavy metal translocating P-type ATPase n=1 Tax=Acidimicrobium ferrooxidans (strain DSM 10331 / JCM 15462 / NBRC 103882 / ICP) TaxID=525909 RepID=C7LZD9_ACIFD|nr:heavy metal translocating P-type ATPase [Acidimicrobium ferrooxidans DSM 10331]